AQPGPGLEPTFLSQIEPHTAGGFALLGAIQIDGQHISDGRALILSLLKTFHASKHEETATAFGNEPLQQRRLIGCEELSFQVVNDYGVIAIKIFGDSREAGTQL